jgi:hypothetical protein
MSIQKVTDLPVIEIQHVESEGHYVLFNQKQVARFDGPDAYKHASECCATLVQNEIKRLDQQQNYQVRDGNTGRALSSHSTLQAANDVAWSIENGLPYAGVPANALAVEFWARQADGQYRQMTMEQVGHELGVSQPELAREPVAPHQRYRELLQEIADLRYPSAGPEFRARIENTIDMKVATFLQERGELQSQTLEQQQQQEHAKSRQQGRGRGIER